jgi:hypothetical protein
MYSPVGKDILNEQNRAVIRSWHEASETMNAG